MTLRSLAPRTLVLMAMALVPASSALASSSAARPATKSERSAILAAFKANDGNSSEVRGVYVSRSNSKLAAVCVRTPEAGTQAFVFRLAHSWRYVTSGSVGRAGSAEDRRLEQAC
ncbi:MAG TPA: hypothetical protein VK272_00260 [Solirubrobacteraceae bacterium]|nr:hypothetical protein [Solirubrobacteraceae bacterium]